MGPYGRKMSNGICCESTQQIHSKNPYTCILLGRVSTKVDKIIVKNKVLAFWQFLGLFNMVVNGEL